MKVEATEKSVFTLDIHMTPRADEPVVIITRQDLGDKQTLGELLIYKNSQVIFKCDTLELPWKDNETGVSCIPTGAYNIKRYSSEKFTNVYSIPGVSDRSYILIHSGNYYTDIEGCILVGDGYEDINSDGTLDVINSRNTLTKLKEALQYEEVPIIIQNG
ncbi:MAG: hypothetical protein KAH32_06100 [Chlamydiia bacterium]|nr:hypothetical protein [Chlamydiia bacterium]